ncbi:MAG: septation protein SepH [Actinomycetota bacterium]
MVELKMTGLHPDGEHLTLTGPDGMQYSLAVNDELRAAVRRDRPLMEQIRAAQQPVRPREIQAMLRAGSSSAEVAEVSGLPLDHVERYEGPVQAEQAWVVQQAQAFPVGRQSDSPQLGDLVVDRLATRSVMPDDLQWSATRSGNAPWVLALTFPIGSRTAEARWEVDLSARSLHALDDESRWLSETDTSSPRARRFPAALAAERSDLKVYNVEADGDLTEAPARSGTDDLLDRLQSTRGTRQPVEEEPLEGDEDLLSHLMDDDAPGAHPAASEPEAATDARVLPLPLRERAGDQPEDRPDPQPERRPRKPARRSVPSWDEIVFGSRNE